MRKDKAETKCRCIFRKPGKFKRWEVEVVEVELCEKGEIW